MKKYASWIALGVMAVAGLIVSIYFAIQPRPIPKIKYSQFTGPEEAAWALNTRLRLELQQAELVYFGVEPQSLEQFKICKHLIEVMQKEGHGFDQIVIDPNLDFKNQIPHQEEIDLKVEMDRFAEGVKKAQQLHRKIAVILPSLYGTYLIEQTPASRLVSQHQIRGLALTFSSFPTHREEEPQLLYPCVPEQEDRLGSRNLGCMILNSARSTYRKRYLGPKHPGLVDQIGQSEYLVLYN